MTTMDSVPVAAEEIFAEQRPRLVGLAYRICGSLTDAEDVVQDTWLRWSSRADQVERPAAWLTTVTSRLAIDRLRARRRRAESYPGPWLPEPVITRDLLAGGRSEPGEEMLAQGVDPAQAAVRRESLEIGFLVLLDTLDPVARAVFVLAEVFKVPYEQIAETVHRSPEACRQIASRSRRRIRDARVDHRPVDEGMLGELVGAIALGDINAVVSLLAPEVELLTDAGPSRRAARRTVMYPNRVARYLVNLGTRTPHDAQIAIEVLNGTPAVVIRSAETPLVLFADCDRTQGAVRHLAMVINPDKLGWLDGPAELE